MTFHGGLLIMEPFTQLSKIRNLVLYGAPVLNEEGQFLFQSLAGLTSLDLQLHSQPEDTLKTLEV